MRLLAARVAHHARLLGRPLSSGVAAGCALLSFEIAFLRLIYPIAIVLVEHEWAGSAVALASLSVGFSVFRGVTADRVTRRVRATVFDSLTAAIERYPALAPQGSPPIDLLESEIAKGVPWVEAMIAVTLPSILGNAAALPVIAWLSWARVGTSATLIAAAAMACGVTLGAFVARRVGELGTVAWNSYQPVAHLIESGFRGRVELRVHRRASAHRARLLAVVAGWSLAERRLFVWSSVAGWLVPAATAVAAVGLMASAGLDPLSLLQQVMGHPSRTAVAASLLALSALPVLSSMSRAVADWSTEWPHFEALTSFVGLGREPAISAAPPGDARIGSIRVDEVRFAYPERRAGEPPTVVEASLTWPMGETLAISGPNGCGKTTLTWLLMGVIEPTAGNLVVEVGGIAFTPAALSGRIAYLPQQPYFEEVQTVDEAIRFVAPSATDGDIDSLVCQLFGNHFAGDARSFLKRTVMSLSVGERRVVALARVLLRNSEIVILDEPEANLDGYLRQRVIAALRAVKERCSILVVSHDEAFTALADRVYRMAPHAAQAALNMDA